MWTRVEHLKQLQDCSSFDVLVIGGGVTGCGTALDLSLRGLEVAVVEQEDWAWGTSGRSTKLLHGGVRYLSQFDLPLIREGLREQEILAHTADYLYRPLRFVIPLYHNRGLADAPSWLASGRKADWALKAGLMTYDLLGGWNRLGGRHRRLTAAEVLERVPKLQPQGLVGGYSYADAQTDDTRLVISLIKTAVSQGTVAVGKVKAEGIRSDGDRFRVRLTDRVTGEQWEVTARSVLSAGGPFPFPEDSTVPAPPPPVLSKGVHLLTDRSKLGLEEHAVVLPETDDRRVLFVIPWLNFGMVGTTDTPYQGPPAEVAVDQADIDYLTRHVIDYLAVEQVTPQASFAGLRALSDRNSRSTARARRGHEILEQAPGLVVVLGGKLTAYRKIAAQAADRVVASLGVKAGGQTADFPLIGAGYSAADLKSKLTQAGLPEELAGRYGGEVETVIELANQNSDRTEIWGDGSVIAAEVVYAVRHEAASSLADFGLRRTHLAWMELEHPDKVFGRVAEIMGNELDWTPAETEQALVDFQEELQAEGLNTSSPKTPR